MILSELINRLQAIAKEHGGEIKCYLDNPECFAEEVITAKAWKQFEGSACVIIE